jgi:hypothetical protein
MLLARTVFEVSIVAFLVADDVAVATTRHDCLLSAEADVVDQQGFEIRGEIGRNQELRVRIGSAQRREDLRRKLELYRAPGILLERVQ